MPFLNFRSERSGFSKLKRYMSLIKQIYASHIGGVCLLIQVCVDNYEPPVDSRTMFLLKFEYRTAHRVDCMMHLVDCAYTSHHCISVLYAHACCGWVVTIPCFWVFRCAKQLSYFICKANFDCNILVINLSWMLIN